MATEHGCRKLRTSLVLYSLEDIQQYGEEIQLWIMILCQKIRGEVISRLVQHQEQEAKVQKYHHLSQEVLRELQTNAWWQYRQARNNTATLSKQFLKHKVKLRKEKYIANATNKIQVILRQDPMRR